MRYSVNLFFIRNRAKVLSTDSTKYIEYVSVRCANYGGFTLNASYVSRLNEWSNDREGIGEVGCSKVPRCNPPKDDCSADETIQDGFFACLIDSNTLTLGPHEIATSAACMHLLGMRVVCLRVFHIAR